MNSLKTPLITTLFIFVLLFLFTRVLGPIPFSVNSVTTTKNDLLTVDGQGEATAVPDTAEFSVGVTKTANTVQQAQDQTNQAVNKITEDLKRIGVEEKNIKTTNYSVNPNYEFSPTGGNRTNGYTVNANLQIKVKPVEKANQALDIATTDGANMVGGINFTVDDEVRKDLEDKARKDAIAKAKEKAVAITQAAGVKLGRIVNVQESGNYPPLPYNDLRSMTTAGNAEEAKQTELQPGESTIRVNITLSYETL